MRLEPLFEMRVERSQAVRVGPLVGPEGAEWIFWGTGEGSVNGGLITGTLQACNHPRHRPDNVNLPDVHGVITTPADETIYFEMHGFGLPGAGKRPVVGEMTFRTASERLARLNTAVAVLDGHVEEGAGGTALYQVYECVPDNQSPDRRRAAARAFLAYFENPADDRLDQLLAADCAIHVSGPIVGTLPVGPAGARALNERVATFAESHWHFEDEIGEGDRLVIRTVNASVQHGDWNGLAGEGRTISFPVIWTFRFGGDQIAEVWRTADDLSRVRQLGGKIVPA